MFISHKPIVVLFDRLVMFSVKNAILFKDLTNLYLLQIGPTFCHFIIARK